LTLAFTKITCLGFRFCLFKSFYFCLCFHLSKENNLLYCYDLDGVRPKTSPTLEDDRRSEDGEARGGTKSNNLLGQKFESLQCSDG